MLLERVAPEMFSLALEVQKKLGVLVASNALFAAITPLIYRCKEHRIIHKHVLNSVGECHGKPGNHKHNVSNA